MSRRALLIGSPDAAIPGVKKDIENYGNFLKSPLGGNWYEHEISRLENPTSAEVTTELNRLKSVDYSFVVFAGHGKHVSRSSNPIIQLRQGVEISSDDLRVGAPKRTLILDCCRKLEKEKFLESAMRKAVTDSAGVTLNPSECRKYFDVRISECGPGLIVLYACSFDEYAGENASRGGYYSNALIDSAMTWRDKSNTNTAVNYVILDVLEAHDDAKPAVLRLSGMSQTPDRDQPRMEKYFPFAVIA